LAPVIDFMRLAVTVEVLFPSCSGDIENNP